MSAGSPVSAEHPPRAGLRIDPAECTRRCLSLPPILSRRRRAHECRASGVMTLCTSGPSTLPGHEALPPAIDLSCPAADATPAGHVRLAAFAYLARFTGCSREHTESDLRCYLRWCADRGPDPLAARRVRHCRIENVACTHAYALTGMFTRSVEGCPWSREDSRLGALTVNPGLPSLAIPGRCEDPCLHAGAQELVS
jgi:hypothetical protein